MFLKRKKLNLIFISTPIGPLGSGKGGGVELTLISLIKGMIFWGHQITLVLPLGSKIPIKSEGLEIKFVTGKYQSSWQHQKHDSPIITPINGILPNMLEKAMELAPNHDAVLNFSYDWLPLWLSLNLSFPIFHHGC